MCYTPPKRGRQRERERERGRKRKREREKKRIRDGASKTVRNLILQILSKNMNVSIIQR